MVTMEHLSCVASLGCQDLASRIVAGTSWRMPVSRGLFIPEGVGRRQAGFRLRFRVALHLPAAVRSGSPFLHRITQ